MKTTSKTTALSCLIMTTKLKKARAKNATSFDELETAELNMSMDRLAILPVRILAFHNTKRLQCCGGASGNK